MTKNAWPVFTRHNFMRITGSYKTTRYKIRFTSSNKGEKYRVNWPKFGRQGDAILNYNQYIYLYNRVDDNKNTIYVIYFHILCCVSTDTCTILKISIFGAVFECYDYFLLRYSYLALMKKSGY